MTDGERKYIAIDLKSFYASVECAERGLDPLDANLVVADLSRTEKTICLAVSPSLKAEGVPGRPRLFEVIEKVREANARRRLNAPGRKFSGKSYFASELAKDSSLEIDYIVAQPRMALYLECSGRIYDIYLKYVAPEDIHVYSVDEVFIDATDYLKFYNLSAHDFAMKMIRNVLSETGITATAGIGTNMYLAKIAMDINAKHSKADSDGVRIAELDEMSYRKTLWDHRPLTDFWRIGKGYAKKLAALGLYTMGDIARCSLGSPSDFYNEELLYKTFGINAELLIDHAWGWEPCRMPDIKSFRTENNSLSSGQVLSAPYPYEKAKLIVREMTDLLVLDLVEKRLVTDQIVLDLGYSPVNLRADNASSYTGDTKKDRYGRDVPKPAHGSINLKMRCSSTDIITKAAMKLFEQIADKHLSVRRINVVANHVIPESKLKEKVEPKTQAIYSGEQLTMFPDQSETENGIDQTQDTAAEKSEEELASERRRQDTILAIKEKYGKNAIIKGMNLQKGATAMERNKEIGGHKA